MLAVVKDQTELKSKSARTREQIMAAALICYERYGIEKTTLEQVAEESCLSRATVYRYAKNRRELLNQVFIRDAEMALQRVYGVVQSQDSFQNIVLDSVMVLLSRREDYAMQRLMDAQIDDDLLHDKSMPQSMLRNFAEQTLAEPYDRALKNNELPDGLTLPVLCDWIGRMMRSLLVSPPDMIKSEREFRQYLEFVLKPIFYKKENDPS